MGVWAFPPEKALPIPHLYAIYIYGAWGFSPEKALPNCGKYYAEKYPHEGDDLFLHADAYFPGFGKKLGREGGGGGWG